MPTPSAEAQIAKLEQELVPWEGRWQMVEKQMLQRAKTSDLKLEKMMLISDAAI